MDKVGDKGHVLQKIDGKIMCMKCHHRRDARNYQYWLKVTCKPVSNLPRGDRLRVAQTGPQARQPRAPLPQAVGDSAFPRERGGDDAAAAQAAAAAAAAAPSAAAGLLLDGSYQGYFQDLVDDHGNVHDDFFPIGDSDYAEAQPHAKRRRGDQAGEGGSNGDSMPAQAPQSRRRGLGASDAELLAGGAVRCSGRSSRPIDRDDSGC